MCDLLLNQFSNYKNIAISSQLRIGKFIGLGLQYCFLERMKMENFDWGRENFRRKIWGRAQKSLRNTALVDNELILLFAVGVYGCYASHYTSAAYCAGVTFK